MSDDDKKLYNEYNVNGAAAYEPQPKSYSVAMARTSQTKYVTVNNGKVTLSGKSTMGLLSRLQPTVKAGYPKMILGKPNAGKAAKNKPKRFWCDIGVQLENSQMTLTQFQVPRTVLVGLSGDQLMDAVSNAGENGRTIGTHYVRCGLNLAYMFPVLMPFLKIISNMDSVKVVDHYAFMTPGWGNRTREAMFSYSNVGKLHSTNKQTEMHAMLKGKSTMGIATVGLSLHFSVKIVKGREVCGPIDIDLSLKLYSFRHAKSGDWTSGDNAASCGIDLSAEQAAGFGMNESEDLDRVDVAGTSDTFMSAFASGTNDEDASL
uniref:Uncharacterized protein n=1 Tax=Mantoniella antarctica TaxID=81844 RepID=A0A7S0XCW6_9CHLO|mmetsp:Transcript_36204/g.90390  ORF Transcript_36204/g.90390 Transcript_36204/m.90390 type:complete len:318 (+) Transcript_36204:128-1081(+)|eukprot:CAMPEP_0181388014 /NCGR_PEP_ID=MMETSP1106-20121128/24056_1 /TAXON_ID=81844 /ORGANISM="Mantoniella antarctica, Strain SL-175" /LENGTH=317 /DNA_ID=CAMNT_0023508491 /DNA_START=78 /DNA_END=1031 /DNA_ORIENTATION=-